MKDFLNTMEHSHRGFTLIETLVAVTILTLSVVGPLFSASRALVATQISRDHLTASYLAQEGIEYVRMMRDNAYLNAYHFPPASPATISSAAWADFTGGSAAWSITPCVASACLLDPLVAANNLVPCSGASCVPIHLSSRYTYSGFGTVQPFTRTIQAFAVSATEEDIVSTVSWNFHNTPYTVTITDHLTSWQ
jgi:prepilin-type N-terminal cleavage/methylation domain-containing protein